jgi:hypothetical protein
MKTLEYFDDIENLDRIIFFIGLNFILFWIDVISLVDFVILTEIGMVLERK